MKVEYTNYAELKIQKRGLTKSQVEGVIKKPDKILDGKEGRKIAQKGAGNTFCVWSLNRTEIDIRL